LKTLTPLKEKYEHFYSEKYENFESENFEKFHSEKTNTQTNF
jgi:hypothetical protein